MASMTFFDKKLNRSKYIVMLHDLSQCKMISMICYFLQDISGSFVLAVTLYSVS